MNGSGQVRLRFHKAFRLGTVESGGEGNRYRGRVENLRQVRGISSVSPEIFRVCRT